LSVQTTVFIPCWLKLASLERAIRALLEQDEPFSLWVFLQGARLAGPRGDRLEVELAKQSYTSPEFKEPVAFLRELTRKQRLGPMREIKLELSRENLGLGAAKARALAGCETPYLLSLDDDVLLEKDALARLLESMRTHSKAGMISADLPKRHYGHWEFAKRLPSGKMVFRQRLTSRFTRGGQSGPRLVQVQWCYTGATLIRKAVYPQVNFDPAYFLGWEDWDFCQQLLSSGWKIFVDRAARAWEPPELAEPRDPKLKEAYRALRWDQEVLSRSLARFESKWFAIEGHDRWRASENANREAGAPRFQARART